MLKGLIKYKFITILCLWSSLLSQDGKLAVSILDFTGEDVSDKLLRACYQKLETSLIESNQYTVIAKNQRDEILEEQKIQNSGICDEDCAVEIGQLIGAEYLMLGNIIGFPDLYQVNIKIINIEKGDVVEKVTKEIQGNKSDLLNGMEEASRDITRRITVGGQVLSQQPEMTIAQKKYGSMIIESTPSGATILIDNVKKGSTPLELKNIEVGTRKLKLIKTGYITINKGIIINEETPANVSEVFILKTGDLTITSKPAKSMVYLNGDYIGKTPYTIRELTIGDYDVTVSSENYHDETERVMVEYDRENSKNFILSPKPGTVTIIIDPPETKISVEYKQYKADVDGLASIELPSGKHQIDFSLSGYKPVIKNVTLSANERISLEVQMYLAKVKEKPHPPAIIEMQFDPETGEQVAVAKEKQKMPYNKIVFQAKNAAKSRHNRAIYNAAGVASCFIYPVGLPVAILYTESGVASNMNPYDPVYLDLDSNQKNQYKQAYKQEEKQLRRKSIYGAEGFCVGFFFFIMMMGEGSY